MPRVAQIYLQKCNTYICSKMKQFRHKLAQRKGKLGFCREFAPIKWGGVTLWRNQKLVLPWNKPVPKPKTVQSVASKRLSSGSHKHPQTIHSKFIQQIQACLSSTSTILRKAWLLQRTTFYKMKGWDPLELLENSVALAHCTGKANLCEEMSNFAQIYLQKCKYI